MAADTDLAPLELYLLDVSRHRLLRTPEEQSLARRTEAGDREARAEMVQDFSTARLPYGRRPLTAMPSERNAGHPCIRYQVQRRDSPDGIGVAGYVAAARSPSSARVLGGMFWFRRKRFLGSYVSLSRTSRSYVCAPYAVRTRSASGVKLR
jgi:hypothetical protein